VIILTEEDLLLITFSINESCKVPPVGLTVFLEELNEPRYVSELASVSLVASAFDLLILNTPKEM